MTSTEVQQDDDGVQVLPFYIVLDESGSMSGASIQAVNDALPELWSAIAADPNVDAKTRVSIITFTDDATVLVPLTEMSKLPNMPGVSAKGSTSFGAAFRLLRTTIENDMRDLKNQGLQRIRPVCFFISDGEPTDPATWKSEYNKLVDPSFKFAPVIIAFGVAGATAKTIKEIATPYKGRVYGYLMDDGQSPGPVLREIIDSLTQSIVSSARSENPTLVVPQNVPGTIELGVIDDD